MLEKDWDSYNSTIHSDGAATRSNKNGGSGITVITGPQCDPRVHRQCTIPAGKSCSSFQAEERDVRTALKLVQKDVSLHKVRIVSDSVSTLQRIQNLHSSQQEVSSDENEILDALASHTDRACYFTFTQCPSHSGIRVNELADVATKEGTTVEQEGVSHHHKSAKAAIRPVTKKPPITHERLRRIYGERGEKVNHKLKSQQLSRKDQVSISRLRSRHHPELKYWLHKIGRALDTVCRKCGMGEETVEHEMGECPRIHHHTAQLSEPYLIVTNPLKTFELLKAKT